MMQRPIAALLMATALALPHLPAVAEINAPVGMLPDAANVVLPDARNNLQLGTGSTPTYTGLLLSGGALGGTQAVTGTITSATDAYLTTALNSLRITSNNMDVSGAPRTSVAAFAIEHTIGGTALGGNFVSTLNALNFATAPSAAWDGFATGSWDYVYSNVAVGSNKGVLTGSNPQVVLAGTGPWKSVQGEEIDVANLGATNQVVGLDITKTGSDTTQGIVGDRALLIGAAAGSSLWKTGIEIGNYNGAFPLSSNGSLLTTTAGTITNGIDLSALTISGNAFSWGSSQLLGNGLGYFVSTLGREATFISTGVHESSIHIDNQAGANASSIYFDDAGTTKFSVTKNAGNAFAIFDSVNSKTPFSVNAAGAVTVGEASSTGNTLTGSWTGTLTGGSAGAGFTLTDTINQEFEVSTSTLTKTTDTALATVPGLSQALTTGKTYNCHGHLTGTAGASGGIKVALVATASLSATQTTWTGFTWNGTTAVANTTVTALGSNIAANTAVYGDVYIDGSIVVNAGGTINVQAAQNASNATATTVLQGSTFSCVRVN